MYEGKPKKNLNINWKSLLIKMGILLAVLFIILWIVSLFNKDKKVIESNLSVNLQSMKSAATDYFTGSRLPSNVNGKKKVTLGEMFEKKLVVEFRDQYNKSCDLIDSYAEATKLNDTDYTIKVKLVCDSESDYIINTVSYASEKPDTPVDNNTDTNKPDDSSKEPTNNTNNNSTTNKKPTTSTNNKPSTSTSTNKKPITNVTTKPNTTVTNTCTYGTKEYTSTYPVAYVIPGNCAVSRNDYYKAEYANKVSSISATEYKKIVDEMDALAKSKGVNLYVEAPNHFGVYNKNNSGLVAYQLKFVVKQKVNYATYTIYEYYIDQNGNRLAVIDKRNSLVASGSNNNNNSSSSNNVIRVKSVTLNQNEVGLYVGTSFYASATITPTNATYKNVTWSSNNTSIASVSSTGKITANRSGVATITATADGVSAKIVVRVLENTTYNYCKTNKERVYSTSYISSKDITKYNYTSSSYKVNLNTYNTNVYDVEYGNLNSDNDYYNAYNYLTKRYNPLSLVGSSSNGIDPGSWYTLRDSSLTKDKFTPTVRYLSRNGYNLTFNITLNFKDLTYIYARLPYNTNNNSVYFLPIYFDVITVDTNNCKKITYNQIAEYEFDGYVRY